MVRKCCVTGCRGNYDEQNKVRVFRLPKDQDEREQWLKVIPRDNTPDNPNTVVCERHFPPGYTSIVVRGKVRPKDPPTIFKLPLSIFPNPSLKSRTIIKTSSLHMVQNKIDRIVNFDNLCVDIDRHNFALAVTYYKSDGQLFIQSNNFFTGGIPMFLIKIFQTLKFECYHAGMHTSVISFVKKGVTVFQRWSQIDEAIRYLNNLTIDHKKNVLKETMEVVSQIADTDNIYEPGLVVRALDYYLTSRSLYNRLRDDYMLPDVKMLMVLTSKLSKLDDLNFLGDIFGKLWENQRKVIILLDEVNVKVTLRYHGDLSGFSENSDKPAKKVFGIMIKCLYGGPKFLIKMIPVSELDSNFLYEQVMNIVNLINHLNGHVIAVICNNNRLNREFFKKFDTVEGKPWISKTGLFLLYDYVHVVKSIRDTWITEACSELIFYSDGQEMTAKWEIIKELFDLEKTQFVKLSKLTETAVFPKPVERHKLSQCLKIFCDRTVGAIKSHTLLNDTGETVKFIEKVLKFWKIVSAKEIDGDVRENDPLGDVISDMNDENLTFLANFGKMMRQMKGKQGKRLASFTRESVLSIEHTCNGLIDLCRYLLKNVFNFVMIGEFTAADLENEIMKLNQGSTSEYLNTLQNVIEKLHIEKTKLLRLKIDIKEYDLDPGHSCPKCGSVLDEVACQTFDLLPDLESNIPKDIKMSLFYIASCVVQKDYPRDEEIFNDTAFYYQEYGDLIKEADPSGLKIPTDTTVQWVFFSFVMFNVIKSKACQNSLVNVFMLISEMHNFNMKREHGIILSNIFSQNSCLFESEDETKEPALKIMKIS